MMKQDEKQLSARGSKLQTYRCTHAGFRVSNIYISFWCLIKEFMMSALKIIIIIIIIKSLELVKNAHQFTMTITYDKFELSTHKIDHK